MRRVVCAGTRAPEMALRLKYAGWPEEAIEVEPEIEASLDRALAAAPGASSPCPPTPPCWSCASCSPTAASPRSSGDERAAIWHEVECGGYTADLPLWEELADETGKPIMELGCGAGRVALHLAARRASLVIGLDRDRELVEAVWERGTGCHRRRRAGDVRDFDARRPSSAW